MFMKYHVVKPGHDQTFIWISTNAVELGYNVMKGTEYFVSL
jgi:hypothetical protein